MKKLSFRKRLCCSVAAVLSLFGVCGNDLHATSGSMLGNTPIAANDFQQSTQVNITYDPGLLDAPDLPRIQTVGVGSTVTFTDMGANVPNYKIIGWHMTPMPFVTSLAMEDIITTTAAFYAIGGSYTITEDMTLYAVWAIDRDNNGYPDYGQAIIRPKLSKELYESIMSGLDKEDDGMSLRSVPAWNNNYDMTALYDSVYYVGCVYDNEYEDLIYLNPRYSFDKQKARPNKPMDFVIEYGGVLEENSMIGGQQFKALDTIKITQDMVNRGFTVDSLINIYPFRFNSIKEDGQGILKMRFMIAGTDTYAAPSDFSTTFGWTNLFENPETGQPDSVLTIKFNIYNKPEFESEVISQRVDLQGNIDLKHVSGTPIKYMMRTIDGLRWRPADSPLSKTEQDEIRDSASICLREMDRMIGYQQFIVEDFLSNEFSDSTINENYTSYRTDLYNYYFPQICDSIWNYYFITDPSYVPTIQPVYASFMAMPGMTHQIAIETCILMFEGLIALSDTHYTNAVTEAKTMAIAMMPAYGRYLADQVFVPAPCREMNCLTFEKRVPPTIQREVYIPQVSGVTIIDPGYGTHYVESQGDFEFSAKYATEQPLKVMTNRVIDGEIEELSGTLNENGEYEYVIRRVTENIVLTFGPETVDNTSVIDGTTVWSYNGTIYIHVEKEDIASIYSVAGQMVKRIELSEGETSVPVERGVYIVALKNGSVHKVIVK